jgi:hypothetical protein
MTIVYGIGIRDEGDFATTTDGKHTQLYTLWKNMLARCYSKTMLKNRPTYQNCSVEGDFIYFQKFAKWYSCQITDSTVEYQLDKDLLVKGNKIYSEQYCILVPRKVNMFLCKSKASRGEYPIGVTCDKRSGKFIAQVNRGANRVASYHNTPVEAFQAYCEMKRTEGLKLIQIYRGKCDDRVIQAIENYKVEVTD